jgi:putative Holliday junction resolvase
MGRILAIDFGQKRCGIAVTDELGIIANALKTVDTKSLMPFLKEYSQQENLSLFVIGEPKQMNNKASDSARFIEPFIGRLKKEIPNIPIERMDERFTSRMAFQSMIDAGLGKKARRNKGLVDSISATLILQSYLETKIQR